MGVRTPGKGEGSRLARMGVRTWGETGERENTARLVTAGVRALGRREKSCRSFLWLGPTPHSVSGVPGSEILAGLLSYGAHSQGAVSDPIFRDIPMIWNV